MPSDQSAQGEKILAVVNAAASPVDLAAALTVSGDRGEGLLAARALLREREANGPFPDVAAVVAAIGRHIPAPFDEVAPEIADLASSVGSRLVGLVDPDTSFSTLERADGGNVSHRGTLDLERPRLSGLVDYEDFVVELGLPGPSGFIAWVSDSVAESVPVRSGEIHVTDKSYRSLLARDFSSAVVTEVTFPRCDASSADSSSLSVTFRPEAIRQRSKGTQLAKVSTAPNMWQAANFLLSVDGLPAERVSRVEAFTWKQTVARDGSADVEVPNIVITVSIVDFQPWEEWFQEGFNLGVGQELQREGTLRYLGSDLATELGVVQFAGLTPVKLSHPIGEASKDAITRFEVEMSCKRMRFSLR